MRAILSMVGSCDAGGEGEGEVGERGNERLAEMIGCGRKEMEGGGGEEVSAGGENISKVEACVR